VLNDVTVESVRDFDSFFRTHFEWVARAAAPVARDPGLGQDFAQEAFARLFARWRGMDSEDHARNFAYKVAINLVEVTPAKEPTPVAVRPAALRRTGGHRCGLCVR
jgi:hypothetical protein